MLYLRGKVSKVFKEVTEARTSAMQAKTPGEHAKAENMLTDALKSVFAVAESYPDLKSSQNFLQLQDELSDAENKIQAARRLREQIAQAELDRASRAEKMGYHRMPYEDLFRMYIGQLGAASKDRPGWGGQLLGGLGTLGSGVGAVGKAFS